MSLMGCTSIITPAQAFVGPETAKFLTGALGLRKTDSLHADADMKLFTGAK
jgi:hypothetical protein